MKWRLDKIGPGENYEYVCEAVNKKYKRSKGVAMPTKEEFKLADISPQCFEGLRAIAKWCERNPYITPTQYARQRHISDGLKFTGPMIAGGVLAKWVRDGVLRRFKINRHPRYPDTVLYGYVLSELGVYRLAFLETSEVLHISTYKPRSHKRRKPKEPNHEAQDPAAFVHEKSIHDCERSFSTSHPFYESSELGAEPDNRSVCPDERTSAAS